MSNFNEILFKTSVLSMCIDGELQSEEMEFFKSFSKGNTYFSEFVVEKKFRSVVDGIRFDLNGFIEGLTEDVRESDLEKQYILIILDVVIALIQSDDKVDQNEVFLLRKLLDIFNLDREFLLGRYPDLSDALMQPEAKMEERSFDDIVIEYD
jgi:hypothetical protein